MTAIKPPKVPCGSCPYRRDVPAGIWCADEYDKLPGYDAPTGEQPTQLFMCHQQDGCLCAGWLLAHDRYELLALRIWPHALDPSVWTYTAATPVFSSGAEAAAHGKSGIDNLTPAARRKIAGLIRQREARKS